MTATSLGSAERQNLMPIKYTHQLYPVNCCGYIVYMGDNIADWTAYKLRQLTEQLEAKGRLDLADAMQTALDAYLLGDIGVSFAGGWPIITTEGKHKKTI